MKCKYPVVLILSLCTFCVQAQQNPLNDNVTKEDWSLIKSKAIASYSHLHLLENTLTTATNAPQAHVLFRWPLRVNGSYDEVPNYYTLSNYVDDNNTSAVVEYSCSSRAYDGHNGIDISIWPFWWHMMDNEYVQVVAAAPGIVIDVIDNNNNDDNCTCTGNNNRISILHADSSISIYYHIKDNSARVASGEIVLEGQCIASVGSSGCSSNPHLHFEVQDKNGNLIDPYTGANPATDCNNRNEDSWWQNQKPYWEPQINRISTHGQGPLDGTCRFQENIFFQNSFQAGEVLYVAIAMHAYLLNTSISFSIRNPSGNVIYNGSHTNTSGNAERWLLNFPYQLPSNAPSGTYQIVASYQGITYWHYFTISCVSAYTLTGTLTGARGYIASGTIQSDATLPDGSKIKMQAAGVIQLNPGFTAVAGTTFKARIKDCNYSD